ncbi:MAG TPA: selenide, water dikinase SelD [Gemmata sp.]|nr:selenide, water dikinase SelD [Gemmata sp.]
MLRPERASPIERRVILVGAGNAHLLFVSRWGMNPVPGVAVTLINDSPTIPYSAMVPGHIAGEYRRDEVIIDLVRLCPAHGVRLLAEPVTRIIAAERKLHFANRPPINYDILSLGLGSIPKPAPGAEGTQWSFALRPLDKLLDRLNLLENHLRISQKPFRFAVVGGGASGCELALAIQKRFAGYPGFSLMLLHAGERLMPNFPVRAVRSFEDQFRLLGIDVRLNARVNAIDRNELIIEANERIACDGVLWATDPSPPTLLRESGLVLDSNGYLPVRETLQTLSESTVFGTGDCVSFPAYPELPRNGVMAVRQGKVLHENIKALLNNLPLRSFHPPKRWLSLLNKSDGTAVATHGRLVTSGSWQRRWKDRIDKRWMEMFVHSPIGAEPSLWHMSCGGCGSKVPGDVLADVLKRLEIPDDPRIIMGIKAAEDAAVFRTESEDSVEVQTVDYFNSFVDDPYLFGRIAALHAVSDLHAMNAQPFAALAIATVPFARAMIQSELLGELLAGAATELKKLGVVLAGGHTTEGAELALGFSVTGRADARRLFCKSGLRPGDVLILTKPLGTGALLAAWMRGQCRAKWFAETVGTMLIPNNTAAKEFDAAGICGCTDVTGFGLAGHLLEMLDASKVSVRLDSNAVPVLPGFAEVVSKGIVSTLQEGNARVGCRIKSDAELPAWLFDPQTSGGLLAGVHSSRVSQVLLKLRESGMPHAAVIGEVLPANGEKPTIHLRTL